MAKRKREIKPPAAAGSPAAAPAGWQEGESDLPYARAGRPAASPARPTGPGGGAFLSRELKENILLVVLILYVLLLGLGTAGELFEQDWILSLPLFK